MNNDVNSHLAPPKLDLQSNSKSWGRLRNNFLRNTDPLNKNGYNVFSLMGIRNLMRQYKKTKQLESQRMGTEQDDEEDHIIWKIIDYPFHIVAYFTLLPSEEDHYSRLRCLLYSFTGTGFMFFVMYHFEWTWSIFFVWLVIAMLHFSLFLMILPRNGSPPKLGAFQWITVNGVISATFWMYFMIELLISLLNTVGMVFNLEASFLGFTVLAIGNALPDALSTFALFEKEG